VSSPTLGGKVSRRRGSRFYVWWKGTDDSVPTFSTLALCYEALSGRIRLGKVLTCIHSYLCVSSFSGLVDLAFYLSFAVCTTSQINPLCVVSASLPPRIRRHHLVLYFLEGRSDPILICLLQAYNRFGSVRRHFRNKTETDLSQGFRTSVHDRNRLGIGWEADWKRIGSGQTMRRSDPLQGVFRTAFNYS
jgi:hypothetical protein